MFLKARHNAVSKDTLHVRAACRCAARVRVFLRTAVSRSPSTELFILEYNHYGNIICSSQKDRAPSNSRVAADVPTTHTTCRGQFTAAPCAGRNAANIISGVHSLDALTIPCEMAISSNLHADTIISCMFTAFTAAHTATALFTSDPRCARPETVIKSEPRRRAWRILTILSVINPRQSKFDLHESFANVPRLVIRAHISTRFYCHHSLR
eukprot:6208533-Pleurochrysis_carterae.AAC.2